MSGSRIATIVRLELLQRVRSAAWYVLLAIFAVLLLGVSALSFAVFPSYPGSVNESGPFSLVVYFVLLLVVLVSPTLSGNAINGDRDAATLAPVQVTFATTGDIIIGKLLAAWVTGLAFLAVAVPFLAFATVARGVSPAVFAVSLLVLVVEVAVIAAIGVGLSGILARPLFSVASAYLVVAALVLGTLIAFGLGTAAIQTDVTSRSRSLEPVSPPVMPSVPPECMTAEPGQSEPLPQCMDGGGVFMQPEYVCGEWTTTTYRTARPDLVWWLLAPNPFVVLADATPTEYRDGYPVDLFGNIAAGVRLAQIPPGESQSWDGCATEAGEFTSPTTEDRIAGTVPSWFVGLGLQVLLAALLVWRAWARTRTPARRMPPGTRIA